MKSSALVLVLALGARAAAEAPPPLVLPTPALPPALKTAISRAAAARGLAVATPAALPVPASEAMVNEVRPLYQRMDFLPAAQQLAKKVDSWIAGAFPTSSVIRVLAEIELWRGACLFLARDRAGAFEHWSLAARLDDTQRPDRIFPPEVQQAFAHRPRAPLPVRVAARIAPAGARLYIDGRAIEEKSLTATPELHYVVLERADFVPVGRLLRITRASAELALNLKDPANATSALAQSWERLRRGPLEPDEGLGLSRILARTVWVVSEQNGRLSAERYDAADASHPTGRIEVDTPSEGSLVESICRQSRCAPVSPPVIARAPLVPPPAPPPTVPPPKPLWKQWWLWGAIAAGVVVVGVAAGVPAAATSSRNYDLHIR